jgi:hypothetical protein
MSSAFELSYTSRSRMPLPASVERLLSQQEQPPQLLPGLNQFLNRPRAGKMAWPNATDCVCTPVEILDRSDTHHRKAPSQFSQLCSIEHLVGRLGTPRHDRNMLPY